MIRTAMVLALGLCASLAAPAWAQSAAPQAYTVKTVADFSGVKMTVTIVRDGARERIERKLGPGLTTTLYDFAARRVYWIGWSGAGSCSSGRYLSARAPVGEDPVTGSAESLAKLTQGRSRRPAGTGVIGRVAARIEELVGGKRPTGREAEDPWPTRVWVAEQGGYLLKLEGAGKDGKPVTLVEVTQLTFGKPQGAALEPPGDCIATNSEMDEGGSIRSSATASVAAEVSGSADLGAGTTAGPKRALAKIDAMVLSVVPKPDDGKCGGKLQLTGTLSVDGPATIKVGFRPSVGGLRLTDGENAVVTVDAAGNATVAKEATFLRALKGTLRLQAIVQGTGGHDGPMRLSDPVPFEVTCP